MIELSNRRFFTPEITRPPRMHVIPPKAVEAIGTGVGYLVAAILSPVAAVLSACFIFLGVLGAWIVTLAFPVLAIFCLLKLFFW